MYRVDRLASMPRARSPSITGLPSANSLRTWSAARTVAGSTFPMVIPATTIIWIGSGDNTPNPNTTLSERMVAVPIATIAGMVTLRLPARRAVTFAAITTIARIQSGASQRSQPVSSMRLSRRPTPMSCIAALIDATAIERSMPRPSLREATTAMSTKRSEALRMTTGLASSTVVSIGPILAVMRGRTQSARE